MRRAIRALAALAACAVVRAYPQQTAAPNGTSPATSPGITPAPSCEADCRYRPLSFYAVKWTTNYVTENITYATVITIINTNRNTTRYVTSTIDLPDNYTLPATNAAGTVVCDMDFQGTTTQLPFPSVVADYASTYIWDGHLATTRADAPNTTICSDTGTTVVTLRSHPDFNAFWLKTATLEPSPTATDPVYGDPRGFNWGCTIGGVGGGDDFVSASFTDEAAFFSCLPEDWSPFESMPTAAFLTVSSVSYEGDDDDDDDDGHTTSDRAGHIETSAPVKLPTLTSADETTSSAHTELPATLQLPSLATGSPTNARETSSVTKASSAPAEESAGTTLPVESSGSAYPHTELPQSIDEPQPTVTATAHTEIPQSVEQPELTTASPSEVGTVVEPSSVTTAGGDSLGEIINSLVETHLSNEGAPSTNVPTPPAESFVANPPVGTQVLPGTHVPVGTTSVTVVPIVIPTVVAGTSTSIPAVVVGSTTITGGQSVVVDNTPIAIPTVDIPTGQDGQQNSPPPSTPAIIVGGSNTVVLSAATPSAAQPPAPPVLTIGDHTIQPSGMAYVISGATVSPGSPITLGSGPSATVVALTTDSAGSPIAVVGGSSTIPYAPIAITGAPILSPLTLIPGQTILPASATAGTSRVDGYAIDGHTLVVGGSPITLTDTSGAVSTIALSTDSAGRTIALINGAVAQTVAPASSAVTAASVVTSSGPPLVIYGSTVFPVQGGTGYVIDGQTLTMGGRVTVGGASGTGTATVGSEKTTLALTTNDAGKTVVVETGGGVATKTAATSTAAQSSTQALGGLINSGLGGGGSATQTGSAGAAASSSGAAAAVAVARRAAESGVVGALVGLLVAGFV